MNKYVIKYHTGCGGEFFASMFEACRNGIAPDEVKAKDETNRYDGTKLGTNHQHFSNFLIRTGTLDGKTRYNQLLENLDTSHALTVHGWTFNMIAYLRVKGFNYALNITDDSTDYAAYMSVHKIYRPLFREKNREFSTEAEEIVTALYEAKRARERLSKVSDNKPITMYASRSFNYLQYDVHKLLNVDYDELVSIGRNTAGVEITEEWYQRLQEYRETNYKIWNTYK